MHQELLRIVQSQVKLSEREVTLCSECFEPIRAQRNTLLEAAGKVPQYLYFVVSGYVRLHHLNAGGDELTSHINCPPGFITSYQAFINQAVATDHVSCITDSELLRITRPQLDRLMAESESFRNFSTWVFQQALLYNEQRAYELATLSARERYDLLVKRYPQIVQNVPLQYIASFLGMNAKSLSRIRR